MTIWEPSKERAAATFIAAFRRQLSAEHGVALDDYEALHRFSIDVPEAFWPSLWRFLGVVADGEPVPYLEDATADMIDQRWFPALRLSFAENLLRHRGPAEAVISCFEDGTRQTLSRDELARAATNAAAELAARGVVAGDRVVAIGENAASSLVGCLGANWLGAIWSICATSFSVEAVLDRFRQIEPKVVLIADAYLAGDDGAQRLAALRDGLPTVEQWLVMPRARTPRAAVAASMEVFAVDTAPRSSPPPITRTGFHEPAFILYTSGTTGLPKCIVHGMGGTLLQLWKENHLAYDLGEGDRFFYFTSAGWNMWYWAIIALATGASTVLYEGSPLRPNKAALFDLVDALGVTHLGASPPYYAVLRDQGLSPRTTHSLTSLRTIMSTGSPLSHELFDYLYAAVAPDAHLVSLSGGTEVNACFATGNPEGPVHRGELQVLGLGMRVEVWDDEGRALSQGRGELVCTQGFPSQPTMFWNDPGQSRYRATYFERFPGVWHHGDFAERTASGGMIIHGRSDSTLKIRGHRLGTAEIYRVVEAEPEVVDSIAVGQRWQGDLRIVLFVVLTAGAVLDDTLAARLRERIAVHASKHHVPAVIVAVPDLPRTRTGKKAEIAVARVIHGEAVPNLAALENPAALEALRDWPELAG